MRAGALGLSVLAALAPAWALAGPADLLPDEARHLRHEVPDLAARSARGETLRLSGLWARRPILLALVFTRCAGVCSPFLSSLRAAQESIGGSGTDYGTVVLSFDARDTPDDMAALARKLGLADRRDWTFAVAAAADVDRLARAVGFWSRWDEAREQFDHPAMLVAVDRGRVVRLGIGGAVEPARLQEIVRELRGEFVASYPLPGRVLFRCFEYDPRTGRWALDWGFLLLAVPAAVAFTGTAVAFAAARRSD